MRQPATHIIHKLNLEIEVPGERMARYMYDQAGRLLEEHVLPMLEAMLKGYEEDQYIRLDTLNLNLDVATAGSLEDAIKEQLAAAIAKQLEQVLKGEPFEEGGAAESKQSEFAGKTQPIRISTGPQQLVEAFLLFLETGAAPWWLSDTELLSQSTALVDAIAQQEEQFVALFQEKVEKRPMVLKRLLLQYDSVLLTYLFSLIAPLEVFTLAVSREQEISVMTTVLPSWEEMQKQQYWSVVWQLFPVLVLRTVAVEVFREKLDATIAAFISKNRIAKEDRGKMSPLESMYEPLQIMTPGLSPEFVLQERDKEEQDAVAKQNINDIALDRKASGSEETRSADNDVFVAHAGLILLHPYLQYFFMELGLLNGSRFKDDRSREVAIHLLHYLATGKEYGADFDLLFEKYLCGMDKSEITYRYTAISEQMKNEATSLLTSVIRNWPVLKSTSPDGLRELFLQRKGKLLVTTSQHKLLIERQAFDVLLEQIPWNITLVKLPWHDHLIHVEWN